MTYEAIIWDCDGVLIDSEVIACNEASKLLTELGYTLPLAQYLQRFMGKSNVQMFREIEEESGLKLAEKFSRADLDERQKKAFAQHLRATPGIEDALTSITVPMAVASGSSTARLQYTLGLTRLTHYFNGHIYSAELVQNGKPAPDIFLYAAEKLGVAPKDCLVIEDGIHGVHGAKAAGMDVFAYVGGSHMTPDLQQNLIDAGVETILYHMDELQPLLSPLRKQAIG